jgi:hypothetical protein
MVSPATEQRAGRAGIREGSRWDAVAAAIISSPRSSP